MMRHFDMKRYPESEEKDLSTLLWGGDYSRGAIIRGGATIQGNTVHR